MDFVIAVYRSRNVAMQAYNFLIQKGITAALISTPRGANVGCGLSVKFAANMLETVGGTLSRGETFVGFFLVKLTAQGTTLTRL